MKRSLSIISVFLLVCFALPRSVYAQDFPRVAENVFLGHIFDGTGYKEVFYPESVDTIYLLADFDNILEIRKTQVYYWPLTSEYKADWELLNKPIQGSAEIIQDPKQATSLELLPFAMVTPAEQTQPTGVISGTEVQLIYESFQEERKNYYETLLPKYQKDVQAYQAAALENLNRAIKQEPLINITPPVNPSPPDPSISKISNGFILRLKAGHYSIQVRGSDGHIVPGTQKKLEVFSKLRTGVAYELFSESQWTKSITSEQPGSDIYWGSDYIIYLKSYEANEYPTNEYLHLTKPQYSSGNSNEPTWVKEDSLGNSTLELLQGSQPVQTISQKDFLVSQLSGSGLGYSISEFKGSAQIDNSSKQTPSFTAVKFDLSLYPSVDSIRLIKADGEVIKNSERQIHRFYPIKTMTVIGLPISALLLGVIIIGVRKRLTS